MSAAQSTHHKRFYHYKTFWIVIFIVVFYGILGIANSYMNDRDNQRKVANWLYQKTKTRLAFDKLTFNLFFGEVSGRDLQLVVEKTNLNLSLKQFKLIYNPLYLWIGRFKILKIHAKELRLDTSELIAYERQTKTSPPNARIPDFLRRIKLKQARIDNFVWQQPDERQLSFGNLSIDSRFGSTFYNSPLIMKVANIRFESKKFDAFVRELTQEGFFIFDFAKPHIFDESKFSINLDIKKTLLAFHRAPKPWLKERAWDENLEPVIRRYYPEVIPQDHTYVYLKEVNVDIEKNEMSTSLNHFDLNFYGKHLVGKGSWSKQTKKLKFNLETKESFKLSKLPLGQTKFRNSFDRFHVDLDVEGTFHNLDQQDLDVTFNTKLIGNKVQPEVGDAKAILRGKIRARQLDFPELTVALADGLIRGSGVIDLKNLNTSTSFTATNMDAKTIIRLFSSINIPANVEAAGKIQGKLKNPSINLVMATDNAAFEFLNFGAAKAQLNIENKNMQLQVNTENSTVGQSSLNLDVQQVFNSMEQVMDLKAEFTELKMHELLNAPSLQSSVSGNLTLKRIKGAVTATGRVAAKDFSFFSHEVGDLDFVANVKNKHVEIKPITIAFTSPEKVMINEKGLVFDFDELGYEFSGEFLEGLAVKGKFLKANREYLDLKLAFANFNLDVFSSVLGMTINESAVTAMVEAKYHLEEPIQSTMKANLKELNIATPDTNYRLNKPTLLSLQNKVLKFQHLDATIGTGNVVLQGDLNFAGSSNLRITGDVDFNATSDFNPFVSESAQNIVVDLTLKDDLFKSPRVFGKIDFNGDTLQFRQLPGELDNIRGSVVFAGNRISTEKLTLNYDDAPVEVVGYLITDLKQIQGADLKIIGREVPVYPFVGLSLLCDIQLLVKGGDPFVISGYLTIVEGQYHQNFAVTNFILQPTTASLEEESDTLGGLPENTVFDIQIKNTGDFLIKNNLANVEMQADLYLMGTMAQPQVVGQIDFLSGEINAFGISFENATGFAQFHKRGNVADINLSAKNEIQGYTVTASIDGTSDNLRLRLNSAPALDRRDILSLIFYGQPATELTEQDRRNLTQTAAISQLATILADPLERVAGLDVLRVSSRRETYRQTVQRLSVGKSLSERFSLSFTTDIGTEDEPERAFELGYQVFDNIYLLAAKDIVGQDRYRFDINLRFDAY